MKRMKRKKKEEEGDNLNVEFRGCHVKENLDRIERYKTDGSFLTTIQQLMYSITSVD